RRGCGRGGHAEGCLLGNARLAVRIRHTVELRRLVEVSQAGGRSTASRPDRGGTLVTAEAGAEWPRLLAVHAHPDDESSKGAATMARYVHEGVEVLVVSCTGGER